MSLFSLSHFSLLSSLFRGSSSLLIADLCSSSSISTSLSLIYLRFTSIAHSAASLPICLQFSDLWLSLSHANLWLSLSLTDLSSIHWSMIISLSHLRFQFGHILVGLWFGSGWVWFVVGRWWWVFVWWFFVVDRWWLMVARYEFYGLVLGLGLGLWFNFGFVFVCDFGGWGLRLWAMVAVAVVVGNGFERRHTRRIEEERWRDRLRIKKLKNNKEIIF